MSDKFVKDNKKIARNKKLERLKSALKQNISRRKDSKNVAKPEDRKTT